MEPLKDVEDWLGELNGSLRAGAQNIEQVADFVKLYFHKIIDYERRMAAGIACIECHRLGKPERVTFGSGLWSHEIKYLRADTAFTKEAATRIRCRAWEFWEWWEVTGKRQEGEKRP